MGAITASIAYRLSHDAVAGLFQAPPAEEVNLVPNNAPAPAFPPVTPPLNAPPKVAAPPVEPPTLPVAPKAPEPKATDPTATARPFTIDPQAKAAGKTVYLTQLTPFGYQTGPWKLGIGAKGDDGISPIVVQKGEYKYGVSMHPPQTGNGACRVSFVPGGEFMRFRGWAGIGDYELDPWGSVIFAVYGDGRKLWESVGIKKAGTAVEFNVDVTSVGVLTLETWMKDGNHHAANAVWLDPWLER